MPIQFTDGRFSAMSQGQPVVGGRLYTYVSGTTTNKLTYTDATLLTPNTYVNDGSGGQYIALDSRGEAQVWLGSGAYTMTLQDASGNLIWSVNGIQDAATTLAVSLVATAGGGLVGHDPTLTYPTQTLGAALTGVINAAELVGVDRTGTSDSTAAINAATSVCKRLYFPSGTYLLNGAALRTDLEIFGDGESTILRPLNSGTTFVFVCDSGSNLTSNNFNNIYIHDLQLRGWSDTAGLSQFLHLVSINGVTNAKFERVVFRGARGDHCYVGSGTSGGVERHNIGVTFRKCVFDGVNHSNRNGISVIDCQGLLVDDCYFLNLSDPTMPGAIDVEPDNSWNVVQDIKVRNCRFFANGGNGGFFSVQAGNIGMTTPISDFLLEGNTVDSAGYLADQEKGLLISLYGDATSGTYPLDFKASDNTFRNVRNPFRIDGASDVTFKDNRWLTTVGDGQTGLTYRCLDVDFEDNIFYQCGNDLTLGGKGISTFNASYLGIRRNRFINCGKPDGSAGIAINFNATASSDNVTIEQNTVTGVNATSAVAVQGGHTLSPATNVLRQNAFGTLDTSSFLAAWSVVASDPASLSPGASTTIVVTATGARLGRPAFCAFSLDQAGVDFRAYVNAADHITVILTNTTGSPVDLALGNLSVWAPPV